MDEYACTHLTPRTIYPITTQPKNSFDESRIRFPPSYRRKHGDYCGDYTDTARVSGAFTMRVAAEGEAEATGVRPPSYTDRIIVHSLEDCRDSLRRGPYELVDAVRGSDHRPVSQAFFLKVNAALTGETAIGDLIPMRLVVSDVRTSVQGCFALCACACLVDRHPSTHLT